MLILTRRPGERVVIDEEIMVTVMEISGNLVRLGFAAPDGVSIYREEIWQAVKEENRAASGAEELPATAVDELLAPLSADDTQEAQDATPSPSATDPQP
jgi:carbon storage regulator